MGSITLHAPELSELTRLSELCLRSKAFWGYDADFMAACVDELTLRPGDLERTKIVVAEQDRAVAGVAQVSVADENADLLKLFVDPGHMGKGIGTVLFDWAVETARAQLADRLVIEADPGAEPFYLKRGAIRVGEVPSGSITGRVLPLMHIRL